MAFIFDGLASNWVNLIFVEFKFDGVAAQVVTSSSQQWPCTLSFGLVMIVANHNFA